MNPLETFCQTASDAALRDRLRDCEMLSEDPEEAATVWSSTIRSELFARANVKRVHDNYRAPPRPVLGACY